MFITDYSMIKEQSSMAQSTRVKVGDQVCITLSVRELKDAQRNFGGYHDEMESVRILIFQVVPTKETSIAVWRNYIHVH